MENTVQSGMSQGRVVVIGGTVVVLAVIGFVVFGPNKGSVDKTTPQGMMEKKKVMMTDGKETTMMSKPIAGSASPYLEFSQSEYEKALASDKIVFLEFYADWCPICRAEAPEIEAGFDELEQEGMIGFRVNFKDADTDADEEALAKELKVPYQHTKVILKDGKEIGRFTDQWDKETFIQEVSTLLR